VTDPLEVGDVLDAALAPVVELLARLEPRIEAHFGRSLDGFEDHSSCANSR
jgi:hypothetical protein